MSGDERSLPGGLPEDSGDTSNDQNQTDDLENTSPANQQEEDKPEFNNDNARDAEDEEVEEHFKQETSSNNVNENSGEDPLNSRSGDKAEDCSEDSVSKLLSLGQETSLDNNDHSNSSVGERKSGSNVDAGNSKDQQNIGGEKSSDPADDEKSNTSVPGNEKESEDVIFDNERPRVTLRMDGLFEEEEDDEIMEVPVEDSQSDDPPDIQSMLQMSFREEGQGSNEDDGSADLEIDETPNKESTNDNDESEQNTPRRPRRAAAEIAAHTIREISHKEQDTLEDRYKRRGRSRDDEDSTYDGVAESNNQGSRLKTHQFHKCGTCKQLTICEVKVQKYGTEMYFCSNKCAGKQLNKQSAYGRMPCSKCGTANLHLDTERTHYWETMNFCSDICVGSYQVDVGGKCATCSNNVAWLSLGKYCVRFGSDIRQFCCGQCLESYKKNARVCFHCQLDIKRLGNVILVNLPGKPTPKEFCSQDCVEMYVEQNSNQMAKSKSQNNTCVVCGDMKPCYKELVLTQDKPVNLKCCSDVCWKKLLEAHRIINPEKCETCTKFVNFDPSAECTVNYVSTDEKVSVFCSPTCKNVFVLKNRQILACVSCKVKKYNYDLVQVFQGHTFGYAACSLNCLPNTAHYIQNLRSTISRTHGGVFEANSSNDEQMPVINSVSSVSDQFGHVYLNQPMLLDSSGNIVSIETLRNADGTLSVAVGPDGTGIDLSQLFQVNTSGELLVNATTGEMEMVDGEDGENWDGVLRYEDIEELLTEHWNVPEMKTKYTMAKPKCKNQTTETEESAILEMERIPLKTVEKIQYVPFPMPIPVFIPVPVYFMEKPVPYPFPVPIPFPVLIPVIFNEKSAFKKPNSRDESEHVHNVCEEPEKNFEMADVESTRTEPEARVQNLNACISDDITMCENTNDTVNNAARSPIEPVLSTKANLNSPIKKTPSGNETIAPIAFNVVPNPLASKDVAPVSSSPGRKKLTRVEYGIRAWKMSYGPLSDPIKFNNVELAEKLADWVINGKKPSGERYRADIMIYLCLGVQQYLKDSGRPDSIFYDSVYSQFVTAITDYADNECAQGINTRIEDYHFWESQQLGDARPGVLLFTLVYIFYKNFHLKTWEQHGALQFSQIKVDRKYNPAISSETSYLTIVGVPECEGIEVFENVTLPERCPVRLLQVYISKCGEQEGPFYKAINDENLSDSWYTTKPLEQMEIYQMLVRAMMIKGDSEK